VRAGQAAAAAGVSVKALRYYEGLGLVRPGRRANGYRIYSDEDVRVTAELRQLMALGLTTQEAEPFVACLRAGNDTVDDCAESIAAYQRKIDQLDGLIDRLSQVRNLLRERMGQAARRGFRPLPATTASGEDEEMPLSQPAPLPEGLPAPVDDGKARHLPGRTLPELALTATDGSQVRLDGVCDGRWVLFVYPLTGEPGVDVPRGWDEIPGARGCSQEACSFRDNLDQLHAAGVDKVLALSSDRAEYQQDLVTRLHLPYQLLSDPQLQVADTLGLPTFTTEALPGPGPGQPQRLYKRLTMLLHGPRIEHVFYPVFPPDRHADEVLNWVRAHPVAAT
jgi:peroxiredoxin/DNA-binding transcriptional MerR regulator